MQKSESTPPSPWHTLCKKVSQHPRPPGTSPSFSQMQGPSATHLSRQNRISIREQANVSNTTNQNRPRLFLFLAAYESADFLHSVGGFGE